MDIKENFSIPVSGINYLVYNRRNMLLRFQVIPRKKQPIAFNSWN